MAVLVVMPDLHVPTPAVYRAVVPADLSGQRHTPEALEQALTQQRTAALGENVFNRLESIAARVQPALCELGVFLRKTLPTARAVQLSGSGACWFALYMSQQDARREAEELRRQAHLPVRPVVTRPAEARPQ
jgi:4-diphosphocytidyl-2C-methyl-D-erythritol kinase